MKRALCLPLILVASFGCRQSLSAPPAAKPAAAPGASGAAPTPAPPAEIKPVPALLPAVVAKVNGETIELWELENAVKGVEARAGSPVPPEKRDEVIRAVMNQLVDHHVLAQESRARKFDVTDSEVSERLIQVKSGFPTEEAF